MAVGAQARLTAAAPPRRSFAPRPPRAPRSAAAPPVGTGITAALAAAGWSAAQGTQLAAHLDSFRAAIGEHYEHALLARSATEREAEARAVALRFLEHLRNALPLALRTRPVTSAKVKLDAFRVGVPLGRSTPRIAAHLTQIAGPVAKLDADLAPYFGGQRASERLRAAPKLLSDRDVEQEVLRKAKPTKRDRLHRAVGEVLQGVEDLHGIARIAFDAQPEIRRVFRKKEIARGRRAKKGEAASDASKSLARQFSPHPSPAPPAAADRSPGVAAATARARFTRRPAAAAAPPRRVTLAPWSRSSPSPRPIAPSSTT